MKLTSTMLAAAMTAAAVNAAPVHGSTGLANQPQDTGKTVTLNAMGELQKRSPPGESSSKMTLADDSGSEQLPKTIEELIDEDLRTTQKDGIKQHFHGVPQVKNDAAGKAALLHWKNKLNKYNPTLVDEVVNSDPKLGVAHRRVERKLKSPTGEGSQSFFEHNSAKGALETLDPTTAASKIPNADVVAKMTTIEHLFRNI